MSELLEVADIAEIEPGSAEVDKELHKLTHNLLALDTMIREQGKETLAMKWEYDKALKDVLDKKQIPPHIGKGSAVVYARLQIADLEAAHEAAKNDLQYLVNKRESQVQAINTYKKTRLLHA